MKKLLASVLAVTISIGSAFTVFADNPKGYPSTTQMQGKEVTAQEALQTALSNIENYSTYHMSSYMNSYAITNIMGMESEVNSVATNEGVFKDGKYFMSNRQKTISPMGDQEMNYDLYFNGSKIFMDFGDGWEDLGQSVSNVMNSIMGNLSNNQAILESKQLELFGQDSVYFLPSEEIDGRSYYKIYVTVNGDEVKNLLNGVLDPELLGGFTTELIEETDPDEEVDAETTDSIVELVGAMMQNMNLSYDYTYYIDAETLTFSKLKMDMNMSFSTNIEGYSMQMTNITNMLMSFYDFGAEVELPEIELE